MSALMENINKVLRQHNYKDVVTEMKFLSRVNDKSKYFVVIKNEKHPAQKATMLVKLNQNGRTVLEVYYDSTVLCAR